MYRAIMILCFLSFIMLLSTHGGEKEGVSGKRTRAKIVRVVPVIKVLYGKDMKVCLEVENISGEALKYVETGRTRGISDLSIRLWRDGQLVRMPSFRESEEVVRELRSGGAISHKIDMRGTYPRLIPGRYELRATCDIPMNDARVTRDGITSFLIDQTLLYLDVEEPLPVQLKSKSVHRIKRMQNKTHEYYGIDIGLGPTRRKEATLFVVIRKSKRGSSKMIEKPHAVFRLTQVHPEASIQSKLYNPFPNSQKPIIQLHVLVTAPKQPQRYFVIDLEPHTLPKVPIVTVKKKLSTGMRYRLHQKPLGSVKLVPVDK